jgi:hypothetical protein
MCPLYLLKLLDMFDGLCSMDSETTEPISMIWHRDRLDLGKGHSIPFVTKKVKGSINGPDKVRSAVGCCYNNWKHLLLQKRLSPLLFNLYTRC